MDFKEQYAEYMSGTENAALEKIINYLQEELPYFWIDDYRNFCVKSGEISRVSINSFEYIFDDCTMLQGSPIKLIDSRLIAVFGKSSPSKKHRDDYRLQGWLGPTNTFFGAEWDKGHYMAHSIGGAVDGVELNVFRHKRGLNRGWSDEGILFRKMETYCFNFPGTFCFNRPIYKDHTAKPSFYDYGLLTHDSKLWVERFDNRI